MLLRRRTPPGTPRHTDARTLRTKRAVAGELARHGSGYVLAAYLVALVALRANGRRPRSADVRAVAAVAVVQPFFEWALHRFVLHGPARTVRGRPVDPGAPHRGHHTVPDDVAGALLGTAYAATNGAGVAVLGGLVGLAAAGPAGVLSAAAAGEAGLLAYEWTHLLSHSGYTPRTRWYKKLRAAHLRHHFRDEATNFGVTSRLADRLLHTAA